jgi:hypothetical protein
VSRGDRPETDSEIIVIIIIIIIAQNHALQTEYCGTKILQRQQM